MLFHIGILLLFAGHFIGLLTPHTVYEALGVSVPSKQMLAVTAGGIFGMICFVGLTILLHRRLFDPRIRGTSAPMDIFILCLLWVQLTLGLITIPFSLQHMDGSVMLVLVRVGAAHRHLPLRRVGTRRRRRRSPTSSTSSWA